MSQENKDYLGLNLPPELYSEILKNFNIPESLRTLAFVNKQALEVVTQLVNKKMDEVNKTFVERTGYVNTFLEQEKSSGNYSLDMEREAFSNLYEIAVLEAVAGGYFPLLWRKMTNSPEDIAFNKGLSDAVANLLQSDESISDRLKHIKQLGLPNLEITAADIKKSLYGAQLKGSHFDYVDLSGADLRNADLRNTRLGNADLQHADLRGADLRDAYANKTNFQNTNMQGAYLRNADLVDAKFQGANLVGVDTSQLYFADLSEMHTKDNSLPHDHNIADSELQEEHLTDDFSYESDDYFPGEDSEESSMEDSSVEDDDVQVKIESTEPQTEPSNWMSKVTLVFESIGTDIKNYFSPINKDESSSDNPAEKRQGIQTENSSNDKQSVDLSSRFSIEQKSSELEKDSEKQASMTPKK